MMRRRGAARFAGAALLAAFAAGCVDDPGVIVAIPGAAVVVVAFGNPFVLGGVTLAAALLVGWAFWPREPARRRDRDDGARDAGDGAVLAGVHEADAVARDVGAHDEGRT